MSYEEILKNLAEGLKEKGNINFEAKDKITRDEAMENIAEPIARAICDGVKISIKGSATVEQINAIVDAKEGDIYAVEDDGVIINKDLTTVEVSAGDLVMFDGNSWTMFFHIDLSGYVTKLELSVVLEQINVAINTAISNHNVDENAHEDIRQAISDVDEKFEVVAESLNELDARQTATENAVNEKNIGDRIADSLDAQVLKVGGVDVLATDGDASNTTVTFEQAQSRGTVDNDFASGSKLSVLMGRMKKWFADLKALAFKDKADLTQDVSNVLPIANGGTGASTAQDARTNLDVYSKGEANSAFATAAQGAKADSAIQGVEVNGSELIPDDQKKVNIQVPTTAADVSALPASTKYAANISLSVNTSTYVCTVQLKDQDGNNIGNASSIDLPLESVVVSGSYNPTTKKVVLTLQNGSTVEFSVADLVSGLLSENGDGKNVTVTFTQANSRANISTGETLATMFGKIKKWFADLGTAAFKTLVTSWSNTTSNDNVPSEKLVKESIDAVSTGRTTDAEVVAESLNELDARQTATENAVNEKNIGDRIADSLDAQVLKVGGVDVLATDGDASNTTVTFEQAQSRGTVDNDFASGSKLSVLMGRMKKWFADLKALAFKDKADLTQDVSNVLPIANGGTGASTAQDARTNLDVYSKGEANSAFATAAQGAKADSAIQGVEVNGSELIPDDQKKVNIQVPTTAADVSALPASTKYAANISLSVNTSTYVCTVQLKDQDGNNIGNASSIDLPLESVVVSGSYNPTTKKVVLTLQNGSTVEFSVADLVSGLLSENGDGKNVTVTFTQANSRANISTGETLATMFGKIKKWFADLGTAAFKTLVTSWSNTTSNDNVPSEKLVKESIDAISTGRTTDAEVVAESLNNLDSRMQALEDYDRSLLGDSTADSINTQVLKIGGDEVNPGEATPQAVGSSASVGSSTNFSREDHKHKIVVDTGDNDGQVKVAGQNAYVKGFSDVKTKAGSAIQGVEVNGSTLTPDASKIVSIPTASDLQHGTVQFMNSEEASLLFSAAWDAASST